MYFFPFMFIAMLLGGVGGHLFGPAALILTVPLGICLGILAAELESHH